MKKSSFVALAVYMLLIFLCAPITMSQTNQKVSTKPVAEIITSGGSVQVNGTSAQRGMSIFNGSEVQTSDASAFVNFTSGGGVLSIAPGSRVKVSREQGKIIAEVLKGSVTVRSPLASTVIAPDRTINSEPNNLYTVSISDSGTSVQSLSKALAVKTANGLTQTVAAEVGRAITGGIAQTEPDIDQPAQGQTTQFSGSFVGADCMKVGNILMVSGKLICNGNPAGVAGATVVLTIRLNCRPSNFVPPQTTMTDGNGNYKFTVDLTGAPCMTGLAIITTSANNVPLECRRDGNRCVF
jgi:hypothetical protein